MNYKASKGLVLLASHTSTGTEAVWTYTSSPAIAKDQYKFLKLIINGDSTASFQMQLEFNSLETGYYSESLLADSGTASAVTEGNTNFHAIMPVTVIDSAKNFSMEATIFLTNVQIQTHWSGHCRAEAIIHGGGSIVASTINKIELQTSTSTWAAGTRIYLYGQL